jgi:hypothetical protein
MVYVASFADIERVKIALLRVLLIGADGKTIVLSL